MHCSAYIITIWRLQNQTNNDKLPNNNNSSTRNREGGGVQQLSLFLRGPFMQTTQCCCSSCCSSSAAAAAAAEAATAEGPQEKRVQQSKHNITPRLLCVLSAYLAAASPFKERWSTGHPTGPSVDHWSAAAVI